MNPESTHEEARYRRLLCQDLSSPSAPSELVRALYDPSWRVRKAAAERIGQLSTAAEVIPELTRVLNDREQPGARNAAVEALSNLGRRAVGALLPLLHHADPDQRKIAADILGQVGAPEAVEPLVAALADPDGNASGAAAEALGAIGGEVAATALLASFERGSEFLKACALESLVRMGAPPPLPLLVPLLDAPNLRRTALRAVALHPQPAAFEHLASAVASGTASVRDAGLGAVGAAALRATAAQREQLVSALTHHSPRASVEGGVDRASELIASAIEHDDLEHRAGALALAAALGDSQPAQAVAEAARDDRLVALSIFALSRLGASARQALAARLGALSSAARLAVNEALLGHKAEGASGRSAMTADEFRAVRDLVHDRCGILIREELQYVMERRLWARVEALGLHDFAAYQRLLAAGGKGGGELDHAVEALATNETYFFREKPQLAAFREELLPKLALANHASRRLRIWSAGCSTGEEPYTIAMLVKESGLFEGWDVQVLGTDVSKKVLQAARLAQYGPSSMRAMPQGALERHFEPAGPRHRVHEDLRALVTFRQVNLMDAQAARQVGRQDVIFCRNVLIYFDLPARRRAVDLFYERLVEGGYLLLGHAESLITLTAAFELVHLTNDLVYRRP